MELHVLVYGNYKHFVMETLYVCVLCASCDGSQCFVLPDLQFVNAGRGCKGWGPTEGACSMVVPAMSTRPRTSALLMPSIHVAFQIK